MMKIPNRPKIFGEQVICDGDDEPCGEESSLLLVATDISFTDVYDTVHDFGGIMIPAHIERPANSLIATLGTIPPESRFKCAEVKDLSKLHALKAEHPYLNGCRIISDSDAHYLENINEAVNTIILDENTPECVIETLDSAL